MRGVTTPPRGLALPTLSPPTRRALRIILIVSAGVGVILGIQTLALHATMDPLNDLRVYYDAGARLNAGQPLYATGAIDSVGLYLYPPLLAIVFRPLARLPFEVVAVGWQLMILAALGLTLRRTGLKEPVLIALGWLALPIAWALVIGQAEPLLTLMLAIGSPITVAIATNLKVFPILVAVYWVGRRDWRSLWRLVAALAMLLAVQLVLEPAATLDWLRLTWLRPAFDVRSISPFAIHPILWVVTVIGLAAISFRLAPTRFGWAAAVCLAVLAYPRLLVYQLMTLLAAFAGPGEERPA